MKEAWLFPGQGAQSVDMLGAYRGCEQFEERYALICDALGEDPLQCPDGLSRNAVSSLLTVLASTLSLDRYRAQTTTLPIAYAGYSVGQWTALYAAGVLPFARLVELLKKRADLMDACFADHEGAMMAVVGVPHDAVDRFVQEFRHRGEFLEISNYNCLGQVSVAGTRVAVGRALAEVERIHPRKAVLLPVQGAWHCSLLGSAARAFRAWLDHVPLGPPQVDVMDNTNGDPLPTDPIALRDALARHLTQPVQWEQCVRSLIARGCTEFVELGWGTTLTKFGFFIDRRLGHRSFC